MGKPLVMGRKTFASIGRALDGRDTIVVTRDTGFAAEGVFATASLDEALALARDRANKRKTQEVMVIGGASLFAGALPLASRIYWTTVHARPPGDVSFPALDWSEWRSVSEEPTARGDKDEFAWSFEILERVKKTAGLFSWLRGKVLARP